MQFFWGKPRLQWTLRAVGSEITQGSRRYRRGCDFRIAKWYGVTFGHSVFIGIQVFDGALRTFQEDM